MQERRRVALLVLAMSMFPLAAGEDTRELRGCFAPWVRVLMADGSQKAISDIEANDTVRSWNSATAKNIDVRVDGVEVVPVGGRSLFELRILPARNERSLGERSLSSERSFVLTEDHPVYSARARGAVSMSPAMTRNGYQLPVEQMNETELLSDHEGAKVLASVQAWTGDLDQVITLRLEGHHWFYVEGVRMHNKGFGGHHSFHGYHGGGHHSYRRGGFGHSSYRRPMYYYHDHHQWLGGRGTLPLAVLIASSARRRRGTWYNSVNDGCMMNSSYLEEESTEALKVSSALRYSRLLSSSNDASIMAMNGSSAKLSEVETLCQTIMNDSLDGNCSHCHECATQQCVTQLPGCRMFLTTLYQECVIGDNDGSVNWWIAVLLLGGPFAAIVCLVYMCPAPSATPKLTLQGQGTAQPAAE